MPKYAPVNEKGEKPWVITVSSWGQSKEHIRYAETKAKAIYGLIGRQQHTHGSGRRATPEDIERLAK